MPTDLSQNSCIPTRLIGFMRMHIVALLVGENRINSWDEDEILNLLSRSNIYHLLYSIKILFIFFSSISFLLLNYLNNKVLFLKILSFGYFKMKCAFFFHIIPVNLSYFMFYKLYIFCYNYCRNY